MLKAGGAEPGRRLTFAATDLENDAGWPEAVAGCDYVAPHRLALTHQQGQA
jgi:dihydroflavonol-4-reductase